MSPRHGPRPPKKLKGASDRFFKIVTPERAKVVAWILGIIAFCFMVYTSAVTLSNQRAIARERDERRKQVNAGICSIVDIVPPGIPRIDAARAKFKCGPYDPRNVLNIPKPGTFPSRKTTPTPSQSPHSPAHTQGAEAPPSIQATRTATASASSTRITVSRTVPGPTRTHTVSHTATATPTHTPTPPHSILTIPGCDITLLGIRVCSTS